MASSKKPLTLCVVYNDSHILLGMKKRGFGEGKWNGFGGKLLENESIEQAAIRELEEEVGIRPKDIEKRGILTFIGEDEEDLEMHVFGIREFDGEPIESEEMKPEWFTHHKIPYQDMWLDDKHWLPLFLEGKNFKGTFFFENDDLIKHKIELVDTIS